MTLYAKWVPAKITVNTKMEAYLFGDTGYQLPEKLNISVTGETFNYKGASVGFKGYSINLLLQFF